LEPVANPPLRNEARLLITVSIGPTRVTTDNLRAC
jgi:hypothetical protein